MCVTATETKVLAAVADAVRQSGGVGGRWGLAELKMWPYRGRFAAGSAGLVVRGWPTDGRELVVDGVAYRVRWERERSRSVVVVVPA